MATSHDWKSYSFAIDYTRTSYEAGVPLVDILRFLNSNGYPTVTLGTVEGWIHAFQSADPGSHRKARSILPELANNQTDHPEHTSSSSRGETTAAVASAENISRNYIRILPAPQPASWDAQADRFVMSAYRAGAQIATITAQLNNNGYDHASKDNVISSLTRQGVTVPSSDR